MVHWLMKKDPLFNSINQKRLLNYLPTQHISFDWLMVLYFGRHGAKQFTHGKPMKLGYKLWIMATPLGYSL